MSSVLASAARSEAIQRVDRNADDAWKLVAYYAVQHVARKLPEFTADDVWEAGLEKPYTPSALGPVFLRAAKAGLIRKTNRMQFTRDPVRHRDLTVWESLICDD